MTIRNVKEGEAVRILQQIIAEWEVILHFPWTEEDYADFGKRVTQVLHGAFG